MTLVTAIVPNYNYARTLGLCLQALQAQTHTPLEIIQVDDHSTDNSVELARSLGVRVVQTPRNSGVGIARNYGAALARGEILFFVDSDVALEPDAVETAVQLLRADPAIGGICGVYDPVPLIRDSLVEEYRNLQQVYLMSSFEGRVTEFVYPAILAVRADAFASVGGFSRKLRGSEGAEFGRRLAERYEVRLSTAVRGRHDNDDRLWVVLRKMFKRARELFPLFARSRRVGTVSSSPQARAGALTLLAAATAALPVFFGPMWMVLPVALLGAAVLADAQLYRWVRRSRGRAFTLFFIGVHLMANVAGVLGAAAGALRWLRSSSFRHLYDPPSAAVR